MGRRPLKEKNIRKITKVGGTSLSVTIPVEMIKDLKWREKQKVVLTKRGKTITIKDWPVKKKRK